MKKISAVARLKVGNRKGCMALTVQLRLRKPNLVPFKWTMVLAMLSLALGGTLLQRGSIHELRAQQDEDGEPGWGGLGQKPKQSDAAIPGVNTIDEGGVFLPSDRTLLRGITTARTRIAQGEYTQAIRFLNDVLQQEEDSFEASGSMAEPSRGPQTGSPHYMGVKETARRMIRDLPPEGRAAYELAYRAQARRLLQKAIQSGSIDQLVRIVRQYFYTPAGYEATLLVAQNATDHQRHLAAALAYEQLLDTPEAVSRFQPQLSILSALSWLAAGKQPRAEAVLGQLKRQAGEPSGEGWAVQIAGRQYPLFGPGALFGAPTDNGSTTPVDWLRQVAGEPAIIQIPLEQQWLTLHGNEARNGQAEGGLPHLRVRWKVRLLGHPRLASLYEDLTAETTRNGKPSVVAAAPLAIGNTIITRSANQLIAVDFQTGKLIWAADRSRLQPWEQLLRSASMSSEGQEEITDPIRSFAQRIWEDRLLGIVSSDGQRVFAIDHLSSPQSSRAQRWQIRGPMGGGQGATKRITPGMTNRLSAYDLETEGRLVWEVDGQTAKEELHGVFFLGAPLAIGEAIYCLVEIKSAIYLVALDGSSGQIHWRQRLANLETGILMDPQRRLQAVSPSYDAGILVCPTGAGIVVGVDLAKRSLAWAYRYDNQQRPRRGFHRLLGETEAGNPNANEHWIDSSPVLTEGRVLVSPPESKFLHCLDLATGQFLWKQKRQHYHTLACIASVPIASVPGHPQLKPGDRENIVLLLSNTQATALRLQDGKPAWDQALLRFPRGVQPAGTGFQSHGRYYLPLTSAEVIAIDLAQGTIASRTQSRDGQILGNLICHQGTVLSQTGQFLDRFDQVEVLKQRATEQLAANPNHVESLRVLGEIAYDRQHLNEAIELLLHAHRLAPDDLLTGEVLSGCLLTALEEDFTTYREHFDLLWRLVAGRSSDRLQLLRIQAEGLLSAGELLASLEVCLRIYQEAIDPEEMLDLGGQRQVQVARWVQAQVDALWDAADETQRGAIRKRVTAVLANSGWAAPEPKVSTGTDSLDSSTSKLTGPNLTGPELIGPELIGKEKLQRYLRFFGGLPQSRPWWLQRARLLLEEGQLLAAQQILLRLSPPLNDLGASVSLPDDPGLKPGARTPRIEFESIALLAQLLHQAGRHRLAAAWDQALSGPLVDEVCLQNKQHEMLTGGQCVSLWQTHPWQPDTKPTELAEASWPYGKVEVTTTAESTRRLIRSPLWGVRLERTDSVLGSSTVLMSSRKGEIIVRNNLGQEFFQAKLPLDGQRTIHYRAPGYTYGVSRGNLLVISLGAQIVAFNTLASSGDPAPEVLWRTNLMRDFDAGYAHISYQNARSTSESARLGSFRAPRSSMNGKWVGVIGPVTSKGCVYQDQRRLVCCDPLSGQVLWSRTDVPTGCDLFGDHQYLFVSPRTGSVCYVFRMADGRRVDQVTIPRWNQRLATMGRQIIRWREVLTTSTIADQEDPSKSDSMQGKQTKSRVLSCLDALTGEVVWEHAFAESSRIDIARGRFVAVVEPSGECTILDARTGNKLVHDSLRPDPLLREIHLLVSTDRFTLLTNHHTPQQNTNRLRGLIPSDCPMISGQVASYQRATGAACWNRPADIKQQALLLTQPRDLPILLFVNFSQRRDKRGSRPGLSMLILEMASGRTLYRADNLPNTGGSHLVVKMPEAPETKISADKKSAEEKLADQKTAAPNLGPGEPPAPPDTEPPRNHATHEVAIEMTARVVRLNFTDAPRPPQPPAMAEVEAASPPGAKGLFRIFEKLGTGS